MKKDSGKIIVTDKQISNANFKGELVQSELDERSLQKEIIAKQKKNLKGLK
jgi:hypothetical protein